MVLIVLIRMDVAWGATAQNNREPLTVTMPSYTVTVVGGEEPRLLLKHYGEPVFEVPVASELTTPTTEEKLSKITYSLVLQR